MHYGAIETVMKLIKMEYSYTVMFALDIKIANFLDSIKLQSKNIQIVP